MTYRAAQGRAGGGGQGLGLVFPEDLQWRTSTPSIPLLQESLTLFSTPTMPLTSPPAISRGLDKGRGGEGGSDHRCATRPAAPLCLPAPRTGCQE